MEKNNRNTTLPNVSVSSDLVTSHRAVCDGFLLQALTKTEKATPYIQDARDFFDVLSSILSISEAARRVDIQAQLISAAGFSDKGRSHLTDEELATALRKVIETIASQTPDGWREELVYRYLLTRGDSLGGSMRNITGALAGKQFSDAVIGAIMQRNMSSTIVRSPSNPDKVQSITWPSRLLLFDKKPNFIGNNIDVILLATTGLEQTLREQLEEKQNYLACGELKGGIDPAGADEHWKTANSALGRIHQCFTTSDRPALFFVGAAIEAAMAEEIFKQLTNRRLTYAANFTVPQQVADLASWLVEL